MTQSERREYLIQTLLREQPRYRGISVPEEEREQKKLLRSLLNLRAPAPVSEMFLETQDAYLQEETARKGITEVAALRPARGQMYLWRGDITTLRCDAIVNAANSQMLGCFCPCHGCVDNAVHTFAGVQLRLACAELMRRQGREEEPGGAKITPAFNLPCRYVLHTVGPIVRGGVTRRDRELLAACYRSCLALAAERGLESVAFCCISTGEFRFPNKAAAAVAVQTVADFLQTPSSVQKVIFNVFQDTDEQIYRKLLCPNSEAAAAS